MKRNIRTSRTTLGFTLIELMAAIVIIGVVTAIAVPVYQNHTTRAQFSEANTISTTVRQDTALLHDLKSQCTADNSNSATADVTGKYVQSVQVGKATDNRCTVTVTFKSSDISSKLSSKTVTYTLRNDNNASRWECTTTVDKSISGEECKHNQTTEAAAQ